MHVRQVSGPGAETQLRRRGSVCLLMRTLQWRETENKHVSTMPHGDVLWREIKQDGGREWGMGRKESFSPEQEPEEGVRARV